MNLTIKIFLFLVTTLFVFYLICSFYSGDFLPLDFSTLRLVLHSIPELIYAAIFGSMIIWFLAVLIPKLYEILNCEVMPSHRFKLEDCLNNIDFQGKIMKDGDWISITSSDTGMLLKPFWGDFEARFIFKFKGENNNALKTSSETTKLKNEYITENNYLGFIFRARDFDNYFMLSVGFKKFIKSIDEKYEENLKGKKFLLVTPHVKVGGAWDVFVGEDIKENAKEFRIYDENRLIIRVKGNTLKLWIENPEKGTQGSQTQKKMNKYVYLWHLPSHYRINWGKEKKEDSPGDSSKIPFRSSIGRIGFREYGDEHILIKELVIKNLY